MNQEHWLSPFVTYLQRTIHSPATIEQYTNWLISYGEHEALDPLSIPYIPFGLHTAEFYLLTGANPVCRSALNTYAKHLKHPPPFHKLPTTQHQWLEWSRRAQRPIRTSWCLHAPLHENVKHLLRKHLLFIDAPIPLHPEFDHHVFPKLPPHCH